MFALTATFNHESPPRRNLRYRKITRAIGTILQKKQDQYNSAISGEARLGIRPEYVEGMWKILQAEKADDFVLGIGETHSVQEFVDETFKYAGLEPQDHVVIDPKYFRPTEVEVLRADPSKARKVLKWEPKVTFKDLVRIMVDADMRTYGLSDGDGDNALKKKFPKRWWGADDELLGRQKY